MRIVAVCPKCGYDLDYKELYTDPPIPVVRCRSCSWQWKGEPEETIKVPFNPDGYGHCTLNLPQGNYDLTVPMMTKFHVNL